MDTVKQLLDYCMMHPNAKISCKKSDTVLNIQSDASYFGAPSKKPCRRTLLSWMDTIRQAPNNIDGPIHVLTCLLQFVAASAAEAELGALCQCKRR